MRSDRDKKILPFQYRSTEFRIFLVVIALISYGSLHPFKFRLNIYSPEIIAPLFSRGYDLKIVSWEDLASNIILFMPFGFMGVRALQTPFKPAYYTF